MVVTFTRPTMGHAKLPSRVVRLLRPKAEQIGVSKPRWHSGRFPSMICALPMWHTFSRERWEATGDDDNLLAAAISLPWSLAE